MKGKIQMLKLPIIEFILRLLPEAFLLMLAMQIFSGIQTSRKKYVASSVFLAVVVFLIRMLPINFGVHTFILLAVYIALARYYLEIGIQRSILSALIAIILLSACDLANVFLLINVGGLSMETILEEGSITRILFGLPSLVLFGSILFIYMRLKPQREKVE